MDRVKFYSKYDITTNMNIIKQEDLNDLSQAIFTQIQSIAISSI